LLVICQIDNIYLMTLKSEKLREALTEKEQMPEMPRRLIKPDLFEDITCYDSLVKILKNLAMSAYGIYYYFVAVLIPVLAYFLQNPTIPTEPIKQ